MSPASPYRLGIPLIGGLIDQVSETSSALLAPISTPTVRIGVTGLSRAGKTVFITSLINNLLRHDRLPKFSAVSEGRLEAVVLDDQPDATLPRFQYERNIDGLQASPPQWPVSTDRISQIRLKLRYRPAKVVKRTFSPVAKLNIDLVDYPGEWLLDLPLMTMSYRDWSETAYAAANKGERQRLSAGWRQQLDQTDLNASADERVAQRLHEAYRDYLRACKADGAALSLLQPGRFLQPGDLADSPALTFTPLPERFADAPGRSLYKQMSHRFELYKSKVVEPFFRDHFSRLDRQIVLLDLLGAAAAGADSLAELGQAMTLVQQCLRPGNSGWLSTVLFGRKIDRALFAATKADHLPSDQHAALAQLAEELMRRSDGQFAFAGATSEYLAVSGLRSTREGLVEQRGKPARRCIIGTPLGSAEEKAFYPGQLLQTIAELAAAGPEGFGNLWFEPPQNLGQDGRALPHSRLDSALEFLIGDLLA